MRKIDILLTLFAIICYNSFVYVLHHTPLSKAKSNIEEEDVDIFSHHHMYSYFPQSLQQASSISAFSYVHIHTFVALFEYNKKKARNVSETQSATYEKQRERGKEEEKGTSEQKTRRSLW